MEFIGGPLRFPASIHRSPRYRSYANVVRNLIVILYLFTSNIWRIMAIIHGNKLCRISYRTGLSVLWWCRFIWLFTTLLRLKSFSFLISHFSIYLSFSRVVPNNWLFIGFNQIITYHNDTPAHTVALFCCVSFFVVFFSIFFYSYNEWIQCIYNSYQMR